MIKLMLLALFVVAIAAVLAAVFASLKKRLPEKGDVYYLRKSLLTPAERSFLGVLEPQLPLGTRLFSKVRLEDVFGVKSGLDRSARLAARNRINRKHVDFLVVRASDFAPVAGIELDDSSHAEEDRQARDALVDSVFASAGLPLLHFPAKNSYSAAEIQRRLADELFRPPVGSEISSARPKV